VDQHFNNSQNDFLWTLLANPANDAHLYTFNLQQLVNDFPQSGILQALLAHASDEKNLRQASVYFNAKSLYKLINAPSTFAGVPNEKIIIQANIRVNGHYKEEENQYIEENSEAYQDGSIENALNKADFNDHPIIDNEEEIVSSSADHHPVIESEGDLLLSNPVMDVHHITEAVPEISESTTIEEPVENVATVIRENRLPEAIVTTPEPELIHNAAPGNEEHEEPGEDGIHETHETVLQGAISTSQEPELIDNAAFENDEHANPADKNQVAEPAVAVEEGDAIKFGEQESEKGINEETFDEIIDIEQISIAPETIQWAAEREAIKAADEKPELITADNDDAEKLIPDSVASTDFFMFDKAFGENKPVERAETVPPVSSGNSADGIGETNPLTGDADHQDISKYHDEQMPYTFMWWLDKTRKEHAGTYQPYVKSEEINLNNMPKRPQDELQQQFFVRSYGLVI